LRTYAEPIEHHDLIKTVDELWRKMTLDRIHRERLNLSSILNVNATRVLRACMKQCGSKSVQKYSD